MLFWALGLYQSIWRFSSFADLKHAIRLICELGEEIRNIEEEIDAIVDTMHSTITSNA